MPEHVKHQLWIVAVAATVMFTRLGTTQLWDEDEPKNAACAREMLERGDWVVPSFNYELRTDKPVLLYWLMMPAYAVFGVNEFAARFWSAALAVGTCLCTYHLGRMLFRAEVGLWAGLILATNLMFVVAGRAATPDSTLIFLSTLAMLLFVRGVQGSGFSIQSNGEVENTGIPKSSGLTSAPRSTSRDRWLPNSWPAFATIYAVLGLALLAKGPVGLILPTAVIGVFLLWVQQPEAAELRSRQVSLRRRVLGFVQRFLCTTWAMRPLAWLVVPLLVAGPWYVLVGLRTDGAWLEGFFGKHNFQRFNEPLEGHSGPLLYYVPAIMAGFFPWSVFLPLSVWQVWKDIRAKQAHSPACMLLACWCCCWIAVFSMAGTKLPSYVLPVYPALALITARWLVCWSSQRIEVGRWWMRTAMGSVATIGCSLLVGFPLVAEHVLPDEPQLGLMGLLLLSGAVLTWWLAELQPSRRSLTAFSAMAAVFCVSLFGWAAVRIGQHQNSASLAEWARSAGGGHARLGTFKHSPPSVVFYAKGPVTRCKGPEEVRHFFGGPEDALLVVDRDNLAAIEQALPAGVTVLARQPRFLKPGSEVLLLGRGAHVAMNNDVHRR